MFRAGALWDFGNYSTGDGANAPIQFDLGGDYMGFSVDAIYSHAKDAVFLSALGAAVRRRSRRPWGRRSPTWTAGRSLASKERRRSGLRRLCLRPVDEPDRQLRHQRQEYGFSGIGGYLRACNGATGQHQHDSYTTGAKVLQTAWVGAKYGILSNLDVAAGYYEEWQNNYPGGPSLGSTSPKRTAPAHRRDFRNARLAPGQARRHLWRRDVLEGVGGIANGHRPTAPTPTTPPSPPACA